MSSRKPIFDPQKKIGFRLSRRNNSAHMDISSLGTKGALAVVVAVTLCSIWAWMDEDFHRDFLFDLQAVKHLRQYYRFLTSGLIHADVFHLLFNMFSFHSFAQDIEHHYGPVILLVIFIVSILGGSLLSYVWHYKDLQHSALGASGGVSGIIYANILLSPGESYISMFMIPVPIPASVYAVLYILISYYALKKKSDNIGHDAHIGGALVGVIAAIIAQPKVVMHHPILLGFLLLPVAGIILYELRLNGFFRRKKWN